MEDATDRRSPGIGTLNEKALHADLKRWVAEDGDRFEVPIGRFVADIVRGDLIIEIQTGSTSALKHKLRALLGVRPVRLLLPIAVRKTITTVDEQGDRVRSRRSSARRTPHDAFAELVYLRDVLGDPNFDIDLVLIHEEEVRRPRRRGGRPRRKPWEIDERRLLEVLDSLSLHHPADYLAFLPDALGEPFTTADLAAAIGRPPWIARKVAYVLREMGILRAVGKRGRAVLYRRACGDVAAVAPPP